MHGIWLVGGDWQSAYTLEQFKGRFPSCCDDSGPGSCRVRLIHFLARWHKGNVNEGLVSLGWFACVFVVFINCCSGFYVLVWLFCCVASTSQVCPVGRVPTHLEVRELIWSRKVREFCWWSGNFGSLRTKMVIFVYISGQSSYSLM